MRPSRCVFLLAGLLLARVASAAPGLVVAVDTSRSLRPEELAAATSLAAKTLGALAGRPDTTVVAFEDAPRWVVSPGTSPAGAAASLSGLTPRGDYTLLHDAVFVAVRSLEQGGTVLLLTDGRDENSATTLEDVARLCEANGVRVLAVGAGRRVEERALRRLALLTGGAYLGRVAEVQADRLAAATDEALRAASERSAARTVDRGATAPAVAAPEAAAVPSRAGGSEVPASTRGAATAPASASPKGRDTASPVRWWLLAIPLAVLAAAPVALWASRRRRAPRTAWCRRCGAEFPEGEECSQCAEVELQQRLRSRGVTRLEDTAELRIDLQALAAAEAAADPDRMEKTRVLSDQSVLLVHEPNDQHRSFLLRGDGAFGVGRDPQGNTLSLRDPALSAKHLMVVPEEGLFYLVDLDSTNGTFVNQRRVRAKRLASGDVIRAGQVELEFRTYLGGVA